MSDGSIKGAGECTLVTLSEYCPDDSGPSVEPEQPVEEPETPTIVVVLPTSNDQVNGGQVLLL